MPSTSLGLNDAVLLISLSYSCIDLLLEWDSFVGCHRPIHQWLLVSYGSVIAFRLMHVVGSRSSTSQEQLTLDGNNNVGADFLLNLRHKGAMPRMLAFFTWLLALPFFSLWTFVGTKWFWDVMQKSPQCMPSEAQMWFSGFWLALCYIWIVIHVALGAVAFILERRVQLAEGNIMAVTDADTLARWGQIGRLAGFRDLEGPTATGMTPAEIHALPLISATASDVERDSESCECSICINIFEEGEKLRCLPGCGHTFHRTCIDLWLLRSTDCPLCKRNVRGDRATSIG